MPPPAPDPVPGPSPEPLLALGDETYVQLVTFRRSGTRVPSPVWVARDGDALVVTTDGESGKVKRLAHDPRVELRPCTMRGRVDPAAPAVRARARVLTPEEAGPSADAALARKYGWRYRAIAVVERLRGRAPDRVLLRIER
ncbi:PPOX class F420-dependent oxidoreductase [Cellulomonas oligotrophica]|uniref:PPOX class F420-dependent oxidoreductase n=1 Tax=Cellulomonas oligotrophica TaxID=931536 RepID=A0A7Y9FG28_9CELL|nr:PPOX class F420-dependent oxidoreductase [Cellulomonas oligotrophica]NYD86550.1 hypothetical protein [Cellulomonas oligotrophica]GIG32560.1 PPOX class F420-dependent oxidoreductase [Cellulomonas oligotrophica]